MLCYVVLCRRLFVYWWWSGESSTYEVSIASGNYYIGIDGEWMGDKITDDGCITYGSLMVAQEVSLVAMLNTEVNNM